MTRFGLVGVGTAVVGTVLAGVVLTGCGAKTARTEAAPPTTTVNTSPPPVPEPAANGACPYLTNAVAADKNGQAVSRSRVSVGEPPACFFYRADGEMQLSTVVFKTNPKAAEAAVDRAAPIDTSSKWNVLDWAGGTQKTGRNTVVAVAKGGNAVIVTTNQRTINATEVARHVIETLRL